MIHSVGHWIDGQLLADRARTQPVYNPASGQISAHVNRASDAQQR